MRFRASFSTCWLYLFSSETGHILGFFYIFFPLVHDVIALLYVHHTLHEALFAVGVFLGVLLVFLFADRLDSPVFWRLQGARTIRTTRTQQPPRRKLMLPTLSAQPSPLRTAPQLKAPLQKRQSPRADRLRLSPPRQRPKRRLSLSRPTRPRSPTTAAPPVGTARATTNAAAEAASSLPANITLSRPLQTTPRSSGTARKKITKVSPSPMI